MAESSREARRKSRREAAGRLIALARRAGLAAVLAGLVWGSIEVRSHVRADPRFRLSGWKLALGDLPAWAPPELRTDLEGLALCPPNEEELTVFAPCVLARVRGALLESPWIHDVRSIRLEVPGLGGRGGTVAGAVLADLPGSPGPAAPGSPAGSVDLEIELRVPIALVAAGGAYYLTDREGVRVGPPLDAERAAASRIPRIVGGESRRERHPPPPGMVWEDRDVREGLEVAKVLQDDGIAERYPRTPHR